MFTHLPDHGPHPRTAAWQGAARLRRLAAVLAAVTCGLLASAAIVPAAFAMVVPNPGGAYGGTPLAPGPAPSVVTAGGMAGLADHRDRARRRPGRSHCRRPTGPGAGRPPGRLRHHRMTRPPARPGTPAAPGSAQGPGAARTRAEQASAAPPTTTSVISVQRGTPQPSGRRPILVIVNGYPGPGPLRQPTTRGTGLREVPPLVNRSQNNQTAEPERPCYAPELSAEILH
jgi:hypothetical protein